MRNCISEEEFNKLLEDSFSPSELEELENHIKGCEECRKEYSAWIELKANLDAAAELKISDDFNEKVMMRLADKRIIPAAKGFRLRRIAALVFASLILLYYAVKPLFGSFVDNLLMGLFKSLSVNLYAALGMLGIDPAVVIRLFGEIMGQMNTLLPIFAVSTGLMVILFFIAIIKGNLQKAH